MPIAKARSTPGRGVLAEARPSRAGRGALAESRWPSRAGRVAPRRGTAFRALGAVLCWLAPRDSANPGACGARRGRLCGMRRGRRSGTRLASACTPGLWHWLLAGGFSCCCSVSLNLCHHDQLSAHQQSQPQATQRGRITESPTNFARRLPELDILMIAGPNRRLCHRLSTSASRDDSDSESFIPACARVRARTHRAQASTRTRRTPTRCDTHPQVQETSLTGKKLLSVLVTRGCRMRRSNCPGHFLSLLPPMPLPYPSAQRPPLSWPSSSGSFALHLVLVPTIIYTHWILIGLASTSACRERLACGEYSCML